MQKTVLMISAQNVEQSAKAMAEQLNLKVEIARSRRASLAAVRRKEYNVVLMDESFAETDPAWADLLAQNAGRALFVQTDFVKTGCSRMVREIRSMLVWHEYELIRARQAAVSSLQSELKNSVAGLLLHSELALREPSVPAALAPKLKQLVELAGSLKEQLRPTVSLDN